MEIAGNVERLTRKGIHATAIRLLVLDEMLRAQRAISISELEERLDTVDKSTIFRSLTLFLKHRLIHAIEDGSGVLKYEICDGGDECSLDDMHIHFYCEICRRIFCLKNTPIPAVTLPKNFEMHFINYMVKGICRDCSAAHRLHEMTE